MIGALAGAALAACALPPAPAPLPAPARLPDLTPVPAPSPLPDPAPVPDPAPPAEAHAALLSGERQLTFEGRRAGEGYFSADGSQLVFQSEREPGNPFYQIYRMELETGDVRRVSPGAGKTTCAWIHPDARLILFASTHHDGEARAKQERELELRASGARRRYAWDYDPEYELYAAPADGSTPQRLTHAYGYDAEASYSPAGRWIAFASNRHAYTEDLSAAAREAFEADPSSQLEIYLMRADGSEPRRLTRAPGYDGGPFFSPDGERVVWRRFSEDGARAEVFTMRLDGSERRQLTRLGALSWAPFFHPSGEYVIFASNPEGFDNFELYIVDALGERPPLRVTDRKGFDSLPAFSPDGRRLAWTSAASADGSAQLFLADWDHERARRLLAGQSPGARAAPAPAPAPAPAVADALRRHVTVLASERMGGRATGSDGERLATRYVADAFEALGLEPAGDGGTYFQRFEFTAGVSLGARNALTGAPPGLSAFQADRDWRPLAFSRVGRAEAAEVAFAGYGIVAPARGDWPAYDSYAGLDVRDRWVLVLRYLPADVSPERRQHLSRHAGLRYKAMLARDKGARGLIVVTGPRAEVRDPLVKLAFDVSLSGTSVFALSARDAVAEALLAASGRRLDALQAELDTGVPVAGFVIAGAQLAASVDLVQERREGRSAVARLRLGASADPPVLVGAHVDHLGRGQGGSSLARPSERGEIHYGADDNASGVAALLEIARLLASDPPEPARRDVVFAAWSGEELGLLGSIRYAGGLPAPSPHDGAGARGLAAYLNMDMIGRFDGAVYVQGLGSSTHWARLIERANVPVGLPLVTQRDSYLPTDATSFYLKGIPILSAFTGAHEDYHTPRDTADRLDYPNAARVAELFASLARSLATSEELADYVAMQRPEGISRAELRVFLGTIPSYGRTDVVGVALAGVVRGGPAERGGLREGDVIVGVAGRTIENIYDYTFAIDALKVGEPIEIVIEREGLRRAFVVTPASRE